MQKLTNIKDGDNMPGTAIEPLWKGSHMSVINVHDWEVVNEPDMVILLPYFVDRGLFCVRYEYVPPYSYRDPSHTNFITVISGTVEEGEAIKDCARRELAEETGIILGVDYDLQLHKSVHVSKGNTAMYHVFILPIREGEYSIQEATGDGSESEKKSKTVYYDLDSISNVVPSDVITAYSLMVLRETFVN